MINEKENAVLLSAGFTQREINTQKRKFYNLFNVYPWLVPWEPMRVGDHRELKQLVNKLFTEYLDVQEESDSGNMFHPITISCCRAMKLQPLSDLLDRLKELSR